MKRIDADALNKRMYHEAFETDSDMQKWDGGCWIRYKMFENAIKDAQPIEITEEEVKEYCHKRSLCIVDSALLKKYASAQPEIIRCKDCKYYWKKYNECYRVGLGLIAAFDDGYCCYAERRE